MHYIAINICTTRIGRYVKFLELREAHAQSAQGLFVHSLIHNNIAIALFMFYYTRGETRNSLVREMR